MVTEPSTSEQADLIVVALRVLLQPNLADTKLFRPAHSRLVLMDGPTCVVKTKALLEMN